MKCISSKLKIEQINKDQLKYKNDLKIQIFNHLMDLDINTSHYYNLHLTL
jgi:hypothetical protein